MEEDQKRAWWLNDGKDMQADFLKDLVHMSVERPGGQGTPPPASLSLSLFLSMSVAMHRWPPAPYTMMWAMIQSWMNGLIATDGNIW